MDVDDRHPIEPFELLEIGQLLPSFRHQQLERIHRHGTHVGVCLQGARLLSLDAADEESLHAAIFMELDFPQGGIQVHLATSGADVLHHWFAQPFGRITVQKSHLGAIAFLEKAIKRSEDNSAGNFFGIDKIQRLTHRQEHFVVHPIRDVV